MSIKSGVLNYIRMEHTGALLISGPWGSGKTYYVNHQLFPAIKELKYAAEAQPENDNKGVAAKLQKAVLALDHYLPVMVSAFGVHSVPELEKAIVSAWLESFSHGLASKGQKIYEEVVKYWQSSKKLNDWFDISKLPGFSIGLGALTPNTVVIVDDLERIHEEVPSQELMGMINKLIEKYHLKVLLLASEEHLQRNSQIETYKEKVIEKTLSFKPDTLNVAKAMIEKYGDKAFSDYMSKEDVRYLLDRDSDFARSRPEYSAALTNLRTVKFAINHFYRIFTGLTEYAESNNLDKKLLDEILLHCWQLTIAISVEYKGNRLTNNDLHGLDSFVYLNRGISFDDEEESTDAPGLINETELTDEEKRQKTEARKKEEADSLYCRRFVKNYFSEKVNAGKNPMILPHIIYFLVSGVDIDWEDMVKEYENGTVSLAKDIPVNSAAENLQKLMAGLYDVDNDTLNTYLKKLHEDTKEGKLATMVDFVNATTYLLHFASHVNNMSKEEMSEDIRHGVDIWLDNSQPSLLEKSNFQVIASQVLPESKPIYDYIDSKLKSAELNGKQQYLDSLASKFTTDIKGLAAEICPQSTGAFAFDVNDGMRTPFLGKISADAIKDKVANLQPVDVKSLLIILKYRYMGGDEFGLFSQERSFWQILKEELESSQNTTIALTLAKEQLLPQL